MVKDFICRREMVPGMVFTYGTKNFQETIVIGNKQEVSLDENGKLVPAVEKMSEDTIFDLASVTKLFTSLSILKLIELGQINLNTKIINVCPQFKNLTNVTIYNLLSFNIPLKTNGRVDNARTKEEAEKILFDINIDKESSNIRPYTDMGSMILKYVVERVSGMSYYNFLNQYILMELGLNDTHVVVPKYKLDRLASTNFDGKLYKDGNFSITNFPKGNVYDQKARVMGQMEGDLSGHAGLFSSTQDMSTLAKSIIDGRVIDEKYIKMMAKNRTGKVINKNENGENDYVQYLGFLCYSKNPILTNSKLFHAMSGRSIASAGWTGTQLTIDPINELFFFLGSNSSHNRMSFIDTAQKSNIMIDGNNKRTIVLSNGELKIDATRFAWDRDSVVVHPALKLAIQYKMLEDILSYTKEKKEGNQNIRKILKV